MEELSEKLCLEELNEKLCLSIVEAAKYSGIGQNRITKMLKEPDCPFVIFVGRKKMVKRKEFEEYIRNAKQV